MIKRICPVCDQVMSSAHYCKNCRQFVKNPWVREVGYYLNERHPSEDHTCSYHDDPFEVDRQRSTRRHASASERYSGKSSSGSWKSPGKASNSYGRGNTRSVKKKGGKMHPLVIIFVIYIIFQIVIPIIVSAMHSVFWYWF